MTRKKRNSPVTNSSQWTQKVTLTTLLKIIIPAIIVIYIILKIDGLFNPKTDNKDEKKNSTTTTQTSTPTASQNLSYKIVSSDDLSMKALGGKLLSQYSTSEVENLPIDKRYQLRIIIEKNLDQNNIKQIIEKLVSDKRSEDGDIDELGVFIYDDEKDAKEAYTVGKADWAPNGEWGSVTPDIARNNNRYGYEIKYEFVTKSVASEFTDREKEIRNGYNNKLDELISKQTSWSSDFSQDNAINAEVEKYITKKYSITNEELDQIMVKGL